MAGPLRFYEIHLLCPHPSNSPSLQFLIADKKTLVSSSNSVRRYYERE